MNIVEMIVGFFPSPKLFQFLSWRSMGITGEKWRVARNQKRKENNWHTNQEGSADDCLKLMIKLDDAYLFFHLFLIWFWHGLEMSLG